VSASLLKLTPVLSDQLQIHRRALIVDPDPASALALTVVLRQQGYIAKVELNTVRGAETAHDFQPQITFIDATFSEAEPFVGKRMKIIYLGDTPREPSLRRPIDVDALLATLRSD
jgi:hypothetical protein